MSKYRPRHAAKRDINQIITDTVQLVFVSVLWLRVANDRRHTYFVLNDPWEHKYQDWADTDFWTRKDV